MGGLEFRAFGFGIFLGWFSFNGFWVLKFGGFRVQGFWVLGVLLSFGCFVRLGFGAFGCLEFGGHWGLGFRLLWAFGCLGWCRLFMFGGLRGLGCKDVKLFGTPIVAQDLSEHAEYCHSRYEVVGCERQGFRNFARACIGQGLDSGAVEEM